MMHLVAEFTIEPFEPSAPGPHVRAALDAAEERARADEQLALEVGPFGTTVSGPAASVLDLVRTVTETAIDHGASRVSLQLTVIEA